MTEKTDVMEILKIMAQAHKDRAARIEQIIKTSDIRPIYYEDHREHIYSGLVGSGLDLKKFESGVNGYPTEYAIAVDDIEFFQCTDEPWEGETK